MNDIHIPEVPDWTPPNVPDGTMPPTHLPHEVPPEADEEGDAGVPDPDPFDEDDDPEQLGYDGLGSMYRTEAAEMRDE